jgi:DNA-binding NtrC family response regulator
MLTEMRVHAANAVTTAFIWRWFSEGIYMAGAKMLVVDDEEAFVAAMAKRLARRNVSMVSASRGREALQRLEEDPEIGVVILDIKMPGMDGIDTLREMKRSFPNVEVILLTGHPTFESASDGMKLGAFDYLMKPCDLEELLAKADEAISRRRRQQEKLQAASDEEIAEGM